MKTPINHILDEMAPDMYFNEDCFEYGGEDSPHVDCLTSVENFIYGRRHKALTKKVDFLQSNRLLCLGNEPSV